VKNIEKYGEGVRRIKEKRKRTGKEREGVRTEK
jgi:hypothetical protein